MTIRQKDKLYKEIADCIGAFEEVDPGYMRPDDDVVYPMYEMLVKIHNNWDKLWSIE